MAVLTAAGEELVGRQSLVGEPNTRFAQGEWPSSQMQESRWGRHDGALCTTSAARAFLMSVI
jgi:hypothetical protein